MYMANTIFLSNNTATFSQRRMPIIDKKTVFNILPYFADLTAAA